MYPGAVPEKDVCGLDDDWGVEVSDPGTVRDSPPAKSDNSWRDESRFSAERSKMCSIGGEEAIDVDIEVQLGAGRNAKCA